MIRPWVAIALLAISWLPGLGYYHHSDWGTWIVGLFTGRPAAEAAYYDQADWVLWGAAVVAGVALLVGWAPRMPRRPLSLVAVLLLVPPAWVWPWPYRAAPLALALGLAVLAAPLPRKWPRAVGGALVTAGVVLLGQALAMYAYEVFSSCSHELPWPLPHLLGAVTTLLGQDAAVSGHTVALHSLRQTHRLGATWELLLDPPTLCFLVGGLAVVLMRSGRSWVRPAMALALTVAVWAPVRAGVLMALYMHRVLVTDYDERLNAMNQFWSTPLHLLLLAGPVLLAWRFVGLPAPAVPETSAPDLPKPRWRRAAGLAAIAAATVLLTMAVTWESVGERKTGRVLVDEFHSTWEPTGRPMDTTWYGHDSGYNYACMYDYLTRFYEMGRLTEAIGDSTLRACDVLIVKAPTSAYRPEEIERICEFVERGGGLVLIGEHTDVFHTGECLNAIARRFGFSFRYDCLFGIDSFFEELYRPSLVPHPSIQHMPPLDFAVSCSLAPGPGAGRAVMRAVGLKNAMADYHASNFYPQAEDRPDMRYGAFVQLWATRQGQGRVIAFGDSTQFSNFSMFEAGKPEVLLGMIEWANYHDVLGNPRPMLVLLGAALAVGGLLLVRGWPAAWVLILAVGMLGHAATAAGVREHNRRAMPLPRNVRPYVLVTTDRTVSDANLPRGGFIAGKDDGFGIFERWILRLGYFTKRAGAADVTLGNLVVVINPDLRVPEDYRETLVEYVRAGGKLLVLDSAKNAKSTANSLLWPFGLSVGHEAGLSGEVAGPQGWPSIKVDSACKVAGGQPLARVRDDPVAATVRYGKGSVTVIGFSSRFSDANMGVTGDLVPDPVMKGVYEFEFSLFRALAEDKPPFDAPVR